jgi:hypothetical protein
MNEDPALELRERVAERLLEIEGVHAVGVGGKETDGKPTGEIAIRIFVEKKRPLSEISPEERIPAEIEGVRTDVVEQPVPTIKQGLPGIDPTKENADTGEYRPLKGGVQITRKGGPGDGTLGCLCRVTGDPKKIIALTCHHVVYDKCSDIPDGEEVGQPTSKDSCSKCCSDIFGKVLDTRCDADVDIALIQVEGETKWLAEVQEIGFVAGTHDVTAAEAAPHTYQVKKRGRSSKLSGGHITDIDVGGTINKHGTLYRTYTGAIRIEANSDPANPGATTGFSLEGDSGSAVLNDANEVVGILFGGGVSIDFATPIKSVIDKFATGVPPANRVQLEVAKATKLDDIQTVPKAMVADAERERVPLPLAQAQGLEEEIRASARGAWYADLYYRHLEEVQRLVTTDRRVTLVWHRSGAAEVFQWIVHAFTHPGDRVPGRVGGRTILACLEELAAVLARYGSTALRTDLQAALPSLPDIAGLRDREIIELLAATKREPALA